MQDVAPPHDRENPRLAAQTGNIAPAGFRATDLRTVAGPLTPARD